MKKSIVGATFADPSNTKSQGIRFGLLIALILGLSFVTFVAVRTSKGSTFPQSLLHEDKETVQSLLLPTQARKLSRHQTLSPTEEFRDITLNPTEEYTRHPLSGKTLHPTPSSIGSTDSPAETPVLDIKTSVPTQRDIILDDYEIDDDYAASVERDGKYYRKEIRELTEDEWNAYCDAVWIYKTEGRRDGMPYLLKYDHLALQHSLAANNITVNQNHNYAAFSSWHSLLVYEFEVAIRSINPNVSIPYWNWTIEAEMDDPTQSELWTDEYFGSVGSYENNYQVETGRFAYWSIPTVNNTWDSTAVDTTDDSTTNFYNPAGYLRTSTNFNPSPYLTRLVGGGSMAGTVNPPPKDYHWNNCLGQSSYALFWTCVWSIYYETGEMSTSESYLHNNIHAWGGGMWSLTSGDSAMGDFYDSTCSPNDPLWYSYHANHDRLRYYWFKEHQDMVTEDDPCGGYYDGNVEYPQPAGHNLANTYYPRFYAFRTLEEVYEKKGLTVAESCYWLNPLRVNYTYADYTYYGPVDDDYQSTDPDDE